MAHQKKTLSFDKVFFNDIRSLQSRMIYLRYDIALSCDDIRSAHEGTDMHHSIRSMRHHFTDAEFYVIMSLQAFYLLFVQTENYKILKIVYFNG